MVFSFNRCKLIFGIADDCGSSAEKDLLENSWFTEEPRSYFGDGVDSPFLVRQHTKGLKLKYKYEKGITIEPYIGMFTNYSESDSIGSLFKSKKDHFLLHAQKLNSVHPIESKNFNDITYSAKQCFEHTIKDKKNVTPITGIYARKEKDFELNGFITCLNTSDSDRI